MNYEQALSFFLSFPRFGKKGGTHKISLLLEQLGNPQSGMKLIHVTGTNGKGSVCSMLSRILSESGLKTGLFISPFIVDFRERIQIDNVPVDKELLVRAAEEISGCIGKCCLYGDSFCSFEVVNAAAFLCYKYTGCDIAVLEAGVGGKNDCTNVISAPLCAVLTSIGLDHTEILGDTIEKITDEKCGIIKRGSSVITAAQPQSAARIIKNAAAAQNAALYYSSEIKLENIEHSLEKISCIYKGLPLSLSLLGSFQEENLRVALKTVEVLRLLGYDIDGGAIRRGLKSVVYPARFEVLSMNPPVILDGAHNPNGLKALRKTMQIYLHGKKTIGLVAMLSDKDFATGMLELRNAFDSVFISGLHNSPRALDAKRLYSAAEGKFKNIICEPDIYRAFDAAYDLSCRNGQPLVVCGSLFLASQLRPYIINKVNKRKIPEKTG